MNHTYRTVGVKRIGQFTYNAALSTTHAVTTLAIFFFFKKTMLSYKRLHILQPRYLHEAVSYTSVWSYVVTQPGVM